MSSATWNCIFIYSMLGNGLKLKYIKSKIIEDIHTNTTDQAKETHNNIMNDQNSNTNQGGHKAQTQIL